MKNNLKDTLKVLLVISIFFSLSSNIYANQFKLYDIKAGQITYENIRHYTKSNFHVDSSGKKTSKIENIPYVEKESTFTWDNYGNDTLEVIYKVSGAFGKPLDKKILDLTIIGKNNNFYFLRTKRGKQSVEINPNRAKARCLDNYDKCKEKGYFLFNQKRVKHTSDGIIAEKKVKVYSDSNSDYSIWKNIQLGYEYYSEKKKNGKYYRYQLDRKKVATKINTKIKVDKAIFNPEWLKIKPRPNY